MHLKMKENKTMARFSKNIFNFLISIQEAKKWSSGQRDWLGNKRFEFDAYTNAIIYDAYSSIIKKKKKLGHISLFAI